MAYTNNSTLGMSATVTHHGPAGTFVNLFIDLDPVEHRNQTGAVGGIPKGMVGGPALSGAFEQERGVLGSVGIAALACDF